jgi:ubiquinone/menaquinone biosynthesis C-methylase UbiE
MGWLMAKLYDHVMAPTEEACLNEWRDNLLTEARGKVLEIGAGTGANVEHYDGSVESVTFVEPDPHMAELLRDELSDRPLDYDWRIVDGEAERLPFHDEEFDTVVSTLVLCSVKQPPRAVGELRRVLHPEGRLLFLEHVAAEDNPARYRWQRIVEPVWKLCAGNCHLTRHTESTLREAGFDLEVTRESMRKAPAFVRPTIRGVGRLA